MKKFKNFLVTAGIIIIIIFGIVGFYKAHQSTQNNIARKKEQKLIAAAKEQLLTEEREKKIAKLKALYNWNIQEKFPVISRKSMEILYNGIWIMTQTITKMA